MGIDSKQAFAAIQEYCLAKSGAVEEYPWGEVVWKVAGKMFAMGGRESGRFTVKSTPQKQMALVQQPYIEVAAYVGRYGWVTVEVTDDEMLDLARHLIDESYDLVTRGKRKR